MGELINMQNTSTEVVDSGNKLIQVTENLLMDARTNIAECTSLSMPIAELSTLGAGVASLLPALRTITQTTSFNVPGLYQLVNAGAGDALKVAKNGNLWGAMKTAEGASKMAQFQAAGPLSSTTEAVAAINPATMMMAVALFSIEKELGNITEMGKQILSSLQIEKESQIEGDIKTLTSMISQYKYNWDNELFMASNHKMVLDLERTARKNMISSQKNVEEIISEDKLIVAQNKVNSTMSDLMKKFKYYRLSLYTFSLASLLEIMLSGNFKEEYIVAKRDEIEENSLAYRSLFDKCSVYLEKISHSSVETNVLKGIGTAGKAVGSFIGKIPVVERGQVDEFLQDKGTKIKASAGKIENEKILAFAQISNPCTAAFVEKMNDMVQIYNHTDRICFDNEKIYLIAG